MVKIYQQPFAHAGTKQVIPDASDPQGFVSNEDGFTTDYELPDTDPNYKPIERAEFNGLMNMVTEAVGELQQFGFAKWQPITWPQGARVVEGGVVYRALNQTSQQPPHADWVSDIDALILGLGTAATRNVGTGDGNVMEVGAFGIGSAQPLYSGDLNSLKVTQVIGIVNGINAPASDVGVLTVDCTSNDWVCQTYTDLRAGGTNRRWVRSFYGGTTWSPWTAILNSRDLLASTGQSTEYPMTQKAVTDAINTISASNSIGVNQTWQNMTSSRSSGVTYTNNTGKPIAVLISGGTTSSTQGVKSFTVDGVKVFEGNTSTQNVTNSYKHGSGVFIIPDGSSYSSLYSFANATIWSELR